MTMDQLRAIALALPETTEAPHFQFASFRVGGKIFATAPPDGEHAHIFVDDDERERAIALYAEAIKVLMWGKKVAGIRVKLSRVNVAVMQGLVVNAWRRKAPKKLHILLGQ